MNEVLNSRQKKDGPQYFNFSELLHWSMYVGVHNIWGRSNSSVQQFLPQKQVHLLVRSLNLLKMEWQFPFHSVLYDSTEGFSFLFSPYFPPPRAGHWSGIHRWSFHLRYVRYGRGCSSAQFEIPVHFHS